MYQATTSLVAWRGSDIKRRVQTGSHLRLTTDRDGQHHITIPRHEALRIGTLAAVLADLESHHHLDRAGLLDLLFG